jgi:glycosyltransferase involved in cell wall biosynthesis
LIVGEGQFRAYLERLVRDRRLEEYVIFLGRVESIGEVLGASDIYVHMALHESQGLAVVEAMLARKPVIVANRGGIPEIVQHGVTGLVIEPRAEELCSSVCWLAGHDAEGEKMAGNAFTYASKTLTKEYFARENVKVYRSDR